MISMSYASFTLSIVALILFFWWFYKVALVRTVDRRIRDYQEDLLERHFEEVSEVYSKMRGFKHDFHHHVQAMEAYLELGKYDEMSAYLSQLSEDLHKIDWIIRTGNLMLDSILNVKLTLAEERGIGVNARASMPEALTEQPKPLTQHDRATITDVELCTVIGNLMDNAIEGCLTLDDPQARFIRVLIRPMKRNLYIYVSNSYGGELRRIGSAYATTKTGHDHGFGIRSVDSIVDKYNGSVNRQSEPGVFATEILLPLGD